MTTESTDMPKVIIPRSRYRYSRRDLRPGEVECKWGHAHWRSCTYWPVRGCHVWPCSKCDAGLACCHHCMSVGAL